MLNRGAGSWYTKSDESSEYKSRVAHAGLFGGSWVGIYVAKDTLICNLDIVEPSNHPHKILMPLVAE